jgi:hypothetical protein
MPRRKEASFTPIDELLQLLSRSGGQKQSKGRQDAEPADLTLCPGCEVISVPAADLYAIDFCPNHTQPLAHDYCAASSACR